MEHHQAEFHEVYASHIRQIYAYCMRRTDASAAQDVAAEVFVVLWKRWADRPSDDQLRPWIYGIARNVLANSDRAGRRRVRLLYKLDQLRALDSAEPESVTMIREDHREVLTALSKLSSTDQETVKLVLWEGLTRDEVAQIYGVSRSAIDQRLSRAFRRIGRMLGAEQQLPEATDGSVAGSAHETT